MSAVCRDLACSFTGQGATILSLPLLCKKQRQLSPCSLHSPSSLNLSSRHPAFPSFLALVSWLCFPSSLEILPHVSIIPCEASRILDVCASSSKLIPAIFLPSSGGSFHAFLFPILGSEISASLSGEGTQGSGQSGRFGCGW